MAIKEEAPKPGIWVMLAALPVILLTSVASLPAHAAQAGTGERAAATTAGPSVAALDVVILVDESGSETPAKVADEKQAADTIAQAMLNPASRVTVVGFGGVNNIVPHQNPVDVVCQPTIAGGRANLEYLADCVNRLHQRTEQEGDDTDYAAALGQAMSYFNPETRYGRQSPSGAAKVILMMTDSGLDVHRDTLQYGQNWLLGEQKAVNYQLAAARKYGVQVWPLGFGTDLTPADQIYLNYLASNGAQIACGTQQAEPHYQVVTNPSDVVNALGQLYAEADCLGTSETAGLGAGFVATLKVTIPSIASYAAISVDRGNPGVQVIFYQPDGRQWTDASAISGRNSAVEVLHLADLTSAETGTWKIELTAPPGIASQLKSVTAFWQGAVRAVIATEPPNAEPGQPIGVTLVVLGPDGPITDPSTLAKLQVGVSVSGDGLSGSTPVPVSRGPSTSVGEYEATFTAPRKAGTLTFTGVIAGSGLQVTKVATPVQVGSGVSAFVGTLQIPATSAVHQGGSINGDVVFANKTGAARMVRFSLSVDHAYATIASPTGTIRVPPGDSLTTPFTITFAKNSPVGYAWLEIKVVDAANPSLVYNDGMIVIAVTKPPGFLAKYLWLIVGIIALIILALPWMRATRRRKVDVRGLIAILRRDGEQMGAGLNAPGKWAETFRFIIRDEEQQTARLDYPQPGFSVYTVRRADNGEVRLVTPEGERYDITVDGPGEPLRNGLWLAFRDTRRRPLPRPRSTEDRNASYGNLASDQPRPYPADPRRGATPLTASPDDWL